MRLRLTVLGWELLDLATGRDVQDGTWTGSPSADLTPAGEYGSYPTQDQPIYDDRIGYRA